MARVLRIVLLPLTIINILVVWSCHWLNALVNDWTLPTVGFRADPLSGVDLRRRGGTGAPVAGQGQVANGLMNDHRGRGLCSLSGLAST